MSEESVIGVLVAFAVAQSVLLLFAYGMLRDEVGSLRFWILQIKQGIDITNEKLDAVAEEVLKDE